MNWRRYTIVAMYGLLSVAAVGLPACETAPKHEPAALTGETEEPEVRPRYELERVYTPRPHYVRKRAD